MTIGNPKATPLSDIIHFSKVTDSATADSENSALITVHINPISDSMQRQITIRTTLGHFPNNDTTMNLTVDGYGDVNVPLVSSKAGLALIRASTGQYSVDTSIVFSIALPDDMTLVSDKYVIDATVTASLTCSLFRNNGQPTDPIKVWFQVIPDSIGLSPLIAPAFVYTTNHTGTTSLSNPYHSQGWFTVTAYTLLTATDTLKRNIRVRVD